MSFDEEIEQIQQEWGDGKHDKWDTERWKYVVQTLLSYINHLRVRRR